MHYDPALAYEVSHIMRSGLERMYGEDAENVIFYITVYNEPTAHPPEPENVDVDGILKELHRRVHSEGDGPRVQLLASGVGFPWVTEAQQILAERSGARLHLVGHVVGRAGRGRHRRRGAGRRPEPATAQRHRPPGR